MGMADKVLAAAERWLGYLEKRSNSQLTSLGANAGDGNYTIFAVRYKERWGEDYQAQPWCAVFVSDMLFEGCGREIVPHFAYCPYSVEGFKRRGQWHKDKPKRGDVIFFRDSRGVACHVGLVSSVGGGKVVTIEGNTSSAAGVVANGGCVRKKSYDLNYAGILGYGRPAYEEDEEMSYEQFKAYMSQYQKEQEKNANVPKSAEKAWPMAKDAGVLDGTMPNAPLTRAQYAVTLQRLGLIGK
ncbi:CHAP domain-containing protein [Agathobaculum sp.]|uniref:CHAP domain-containing protein n=1 Tax=Agathobaculum sp. TaxID=2048138 RepID=UPI002A824266|nr:CHAP domain-containing protein [Agathobaculum sp.]MDY3619323.1 CHAP domain-containing protein [Agathobaculum sp.]